MFYSETLARLLDKIPGKRFGEYRFLPFFFVVGGLIELSMIKFEVNGVNFCKFYSPFNTGYKRVH